MPAPAATGPISGMFALAKVDSATVQQCGKWSINPKMENSDIAHSTTKQSMERVPGNGDWDGAYLAYGDTPVVWPGSSFTFAGTMDNKTTYGSLGYTGTAIVDEFSMKIDIEGGKEISHEIKFSGNGPLTPSYGLNIAKDTNLAPVASGTLCKAQLGTVAGTPPTGTPVYVDLTDVRSIDISVKAANKAYHSSSTYDAGTGINWAKRVAGPLDITISIGVYVNGGCGFNEIATNGTIVAGALPGPNSVWAVKAFTSDVRYWEFLWMMFGQKSGIDVDRRGNIVGCTLNGSLTANALSFNGLIKDPAGVTRWPVAAV